MKRLWYFLFGLLIIVTVGTLLFITLENKSLTEYQEKLTAYNWFDSTVLWTSIALILIGLIYFICAFKPSYKSKGLLLSYADGEIKINKKSIEKNVLHTIRQYSDIRQPSINVDLFQKNQSSYMDVKVDLFVTQTANIQSYLEQLKQDIKTNAEHFAELPVREVKINLLDQKALKKRVL